MYERFTERARQVVVLAQDEARALKHGYIGTEHILLGLLREDEGLAARVLEALDITIERVRTQVIRIVGAGEEVTSGQIPMTPRAKRVLEIALREALSLGHNYIGTEHILLGLVRENEGVAARILLDFDIDSERVRDEVIRLLGREGRQRTGQRRQERATGLVLDAPGMVIDAFAASIGAYYAAEEAFRDAPSPETLQTYHVAVDRFHALRRELRHADALGDALFGPSEIESA